jgi:Cu(I)/Ag(I) efflux system membrane protein CusA/SilA
VQQVIAAAVGGVAVTQTVEGRERYGVRVRYPQELRDSPERLAAVLVPMNHSPGGASAATPAMGMPAGAAGATPVGYVPLGEVATIREVDGPMVVRTEGAVPTAWVFVDVSDADIGGYVARAQRAVQRQVKLPTGYTVVWSGQYEYMQEASKKLAVVIPTTLAIIFLLLYFNFGNVTEALIVMLSLPFALVGGLWLTWLLHYNWSVAIAIGFIALAGVAAETGVVMLIYLDHAWAEILKRTDTPTAQDLYDAVFQGAVSRVRPKIMTVTAIMAGLLPILWSTGAGSSVMKRIAAPMVGGMVTSSLLTLLVIPAIYSMWRARGISAA